MNKIYKIIWSKALGCVVVVSECAKGAGGKKSGRRKLASVIAASSLLAAPAWADDLPTGGQVVSGSATINTSGNAMTINQSSDKMIANWQSFSIGADSSVTFNQPGANSVALNRVVGQDASQILGGLNANGQVFLINPNGIAIGKTGSVQTGGFVASTLGIANEDFLAGHYQFTGTGTGGTIVNAGEIAGAVVALIAPSVTNNGTMTTNSSSDSATGVALAAGTDVLLDFDGDGLLSVEVKANTLAGLVENKGLIQADGGVAILTAKGASEALKGVVSNSGTVQANTLASHNGRILLLGDMENGEANVAGTLKADFVETSAAEVTLDKDLQVETNGGHWLIDPVNIDIDTAKATAIETALGSGDVTVTTADSGDNTGWSGGTNGTGSDDGNITVDAAINWSARTLTLHADNNIIINKELTATSTAGLRLEYAQTNSGGTYTINAPINLASTGSFRTKKGAASSIGYTIINDVTTLQNMTNTLFDNYVLGANIDAASISNFVPIGSSSGPYRGTFDGLGHTISNLTIDRPTTNYQGLFGYINGASIQNIGLIGGSVSGGGFVGGLVGRNFSGSISNAYATGSVAGSGDRVGGLVGYINTSGSISNAYATGSVTGSGEKVGGLVGESSSSSISNAYATGSVTGSQNIVGGLVGTSTLNSTISNAYATGLVAGSGFVGGLVGINSSNSTISNGFWNSSVNSTLSGISADTNSQTVTSLTTAQMLSAANFSGFDFSTIWAIKEGETSPYLTANSRHGVLLGDGSAYLSVETLDELQGMSGSLSQNYALFNNIDASATATWNSNLGFDPIGDSATKFTGKFDGLNHIITDMTINRPTEDNVGLFGYASGASVQNIGMVGGSVSGKTSVGGLVGLNSNNSSITNAYATGSVTGSGDRVGGLVGLNSTGSISNAYATGSVSGSNNFVGGLVGENTSGSSISNAYATGEVSGAINVGGLVGGNAVSTITNVYATGAVTGSSSVGGLVGNNGFGTITNGYYVGETTGQSDTGKGVELATIADLTAALPTGFSSGVWDNQNNQTSPYLMGITPDTIYVGSETSLYNVVETLDDLQAMGSALTSKYALFNTIDASSNSNFAPIGSSSGVYRGIFDGLGHTISNLTIDRPSTSYVGLFGYASNATIRNIGLEGASVKGSSHVGGLVGRMENGTISNAYTTGIVRGTQFNVGGLVGLAVSNTAISNSYSTASVIGATNVGGLVGNHADGSTITNAYATGDVSGSSAIGGLVGRFNDSTIIHSYATGTVAASSSMGGLVGQNTNGIINASYFDKETGFATSAGGRGKTTAEMQDPFTFIDAGWNFVNVWGKATTSENNGYMMLRGVGESTLYDHYVGISGDTTKTYGDANPATPGFTANSVGTSNVTLGWGSAITTATNAGSYAYTDTNVLDLSTSSGSTYIDYGTGALTIDQRVLSLTGARSYDGSDSLAASIFTLGNLANGETLTLTGAGSMADKHAGVGKAVTLDTLALGDGTGLASNYTLIGGTHITDIVKSVITAITGITAANKTYDGTTAAALSTDSAAFTGMVAGDALTLASASAAFTDKNAGDGKTVNISGLSLGGTDAGNYTLSGTTAVTTADIAKAALTLLGFDAQNKTYDGTTAAAITTIGGLSGMVGGDDVNADTSGAVANFADKNAGTGKAIIVNGIELLGLDADNYIINGSTVTTADIAQAVISAITGITANNKTYDGSPDVTLNTADARFTGMVSSDALTVASAIGSFEDKNAAGGKAVNITGLTLGGTDAGNYTLADTTAVTTADIAQAVIAAITGIAASSKTYDGSTDATLGADSAGFSGMVSGDTLTVATATGGFADKNAGDDKSVTITGLSLGGADAGNYTLADNTAVTTADIAKAVISAITAIAAADKTYDGSTAATLDTASAGFTGMVTGDTLTVASVSGSFADKNAGADKTVGITGLSLGGTDAGNYTLADTTATTAADIAKAALTLLGLTVDDKTYDGTTVATISTIGTLDGAISGDSVTADTASAIAAFSDKNAGSDKTVTLNGIALSGADAGNYTIDGTATTTADITQAVISVIADITASNKTYDGTTAATLDTSGATLTGMVAGDTLNVATATGSFADKNAGDSKAVNIAELSLGGTDAGNYMLADTTATTTADITQAVISAVTGITAENKTYDGATDATLDTSGAGFSGIVSGDTLTLAGATGAFSDKNAGDGKTVNITGLSLDGADAGNYTLADSTATTTADIGKAALTLLGLAAEDKTYDGTTAAVISNIGTLDGAISGDSLTADTSAAVAAFSDKNAGTGKMVTVNGVVLSGADAGNYTIDGTATTTADIAKATISTITGIAAANKTYDGTTGATLSTSGAGFTGMVSGDALTVASATGAFANANPGTDKTVSITGITLGGADAENYILARSTATAMADIDALPEMRLTPMQVAFNGPDTNTVTASAIETAAGDIDNGEIIVLDAAFAGETTAPEAESPSSCDTREGGKGSLVCTDSQK